MASAQPEQYEDEEDFEAGDEELGGELDDGDQDASQIANAQAELEAMKARLAELQKETEGKQPAQGGTEAAGEANAEDASEVDARSIYVGQVDYACTPEELQQHFQDCGTVNRVTILSDRWGSPKGFAYVEFLEPEAVNQALLLDGTMLHNRPIKVLPKRTNVPGLKGRGRGRGSPFRGRGRGPYRGGRGGYYAPYGYAPRGRGRRGGYYPY